jgi:Fibronectin type III domain
MATLAAPFLGAAPSVADSAEPQSMSVEPVCPAATPGTAECLALRRTDAGTDSSASPQTLWGAYTPTDLQSAYSLPSGTAGSGQTVAVVDAYDLPTAEADLGVYRKQFGLPACTTANGCFRKVNQNGGTSPYPAADSGWGGEIGLDIDMVSAVCPACKILLVEANDNNLYNLGLAVDRAVSMGAVAVSNSYGGPEWNGETSYDTYYNHPGVAITASTGDCGYDCAGSVSIAYPAASPFVVAVGGTSLKANVSARGWTETAWGNANGGAGSGCSLYEPKPTWQHDTGCANRTEADVSAVADPGTGVLVYVAGGWWVFGGTSAASPIIAATYALAGSPAPGAYPAGYLYGDAADLNDVIGGNNDVTYHDCTVTYLCNGVAGYDGPTGLGTPKGTRAFTVPAVPGKPTNLAASAGDSTVNLSWTAPTSSGRPVTAYTATETEQGLGTVTCATTGATSCTVSGLTNGTEYTFTVHATNTVGDGPESDPSNKVTPVAPTVPGRPTAVTAIAGAGTASVTWTAPASGGKPITAYTVTSSPDGKTCATTGATSCTVSGLRNGTKYTFTVTATNDVGTGLPSNPSTPVTPIAGNTYRPVTPVRVLDTRCGTGLSGKLVAGAPRTFQVTGRNGIPAGAVAITGNATVVNSSAASSIYLGPHPVARPPTSTINFNKGQVTNYGVTVALSGTGTLSATYLAGSGTTDLVLDATGYFTPDTGGETYHPLAPARLLDTRVGNGLSGKLKADTPRTFVVRGRGGVPSNARAVTGNVTVVNSTAGWAVYFGPGPVAKPGASTINFTRSQIQGNSLTVALSSKGTLSATFMSGSGNTTDLVFDVTGYYTADGSGASYVPIAPARLLDTRVDVGLTGKLSANTPQAFQVTGRGGVPTNEAGVTGIVSVFNQTNGWAVFVGPVPTAKPKTSALNFLKGDINANGVTVALGAGGSLSVTYMSAARSTADVVLDVTGYFMPPLPAPPTSASDSFDPRAERYQNPDYLACTAASTESMLNTVSYSGSTSGLVWKPTTAFATQESILAYERAHMTMLTTSPGTDPTGWRNALNYYGWGNIDAGVYRDSAYTSFDAAAKAAVSALARYHKPVGILALSGQHAQFITGYDVTGDDPSTGSMNFTIVGVDLTDPWKAAGHRDTWITCADWRSGAIWVRFTPYLETDSPYRDPIDNAVGYDQWYGKWVIIDPIK